MTVAYMAGISLEVFEALESQQSSGLMWDSPMYTVNMTG